MPHQPPRYVKHCVKGHEYARASLFGKYVNLGPWNSPESLKRFEEVLAQYRAGKPNSPSDALTIAGLSLAWFAHIEEAGLYLRADGSQTSEIDSWRLSLAPLLRLYGSEAPAEFTPRKLKTVREAMCSGSWLTAEETLSRASKPCEIRWCRRTVNHRVNRIVRMFGWAVSEELVPVAVHQALLTVEPLPAGTKAAHDNADRGPIHRQDIRATLACLGDVPRAIALFQLATGCRPSEACSLRVSDISQRNWDVWVYRPGRHKTEGHGVKREIPLGPAARWILQGRMEGEFVFPAPKQGGPYCLRHYLDQVRAAAIRAGVTPWSAGLLRRVVATDLENRFGIEVARATLGHQKPDTTKIYARASLDIASRAAAKAG